MRYPLRGLTSRAAWLGLLCLSAAAAVGADHEPAFKQGAWPFRPPMRPEVPRVENSAWVANPIDAFVLAALEAHGLAPNGPADRPALLRRVTFDLTGLAPTVEAQQSFLADESPDAFGKVVDRLLESPRYGERWAQHWLDVVRFAETDGFKEDALRPTAYRYRDYVIRAFNADLPYDRFIRQQLAGDELEPDNPDALVATGLNRLYPDESNAANVVQRRQEIRDDLTEATGLAFLGLTIGCAQCHDHKFDPISQVDYFRMQAFFAPMLPRDDAPLASADEQRRHDRNQVVWEEATRKIRGEMDSLLAPKRKAAFEEALLKFEPDVRDALAKPAESRTPMEAQLAFQMMKYVSPKMRAVPDGLKGEAKKRYELLERELADYDHLKPEPLPTTMAIVDTVGPAPATMRLAVGNFRKPLETVEPGFPAFLGDTEPQIAPPARSGSSGRRAALAAWLCRGDHPLTARVMVNRIWKHHFGRGIVATPNDFGAMGQPPTHPELLDWLAVEFVEQGWSIKAMHRLMVMSNSYRQSSRVDLDDRLTGRAMELDGDNRLLWHARRERLGGEAIRDVMLELSGQLSDRMYGPSARPELPDGIGDKIAWKPDERLEDRNRRSIYVFAKRNLRYPLLDVFDLPDMHNSCPERSKTITAPQALALMNGEFTLEQARHWSGRLLAAHGLDVAALIRAAYAEAFARQPDDEDLSSTTQFLDQQAATIAASGAGTAPAALPSPMPAGLEPARAAAVVDFCHALLNSNELIYVD